MAQAEVAREFGRQVRLVNTDIHDVDEAVSERTSRQRYLYDPGKRFEFLIAEPVLRWRFCPAPVVRAQLDVHAPHFGRPCVAYAHLCA